MLSFFTKLLYKRPVKSSHTDTKSSISEKEHDEFLELVPEQEAAKETAVNRINQVLTDKRRITPQVPSPPIPKPKKRIGSLYTQLLNKAQDDPLLAKDYLAVLSRSTNISSADLRRLLGYFADLETLSHYAPKYDRGYGVLGSNPSVTQEQINSLVGILENAEVDFLRNASETGTYYSDRLKLEKQTLGEKATSLYKEALSSKIVSQIGFSNLVNEFGKAEALAISQLTLKYDSIDDFVREESKKMKDWAYAPSNGVLIYKLFNSGKINPKVFTPYNLLARKLSTEEEQLEKYGRIISFFKDQTREYAEPIIVKERKPLSLARRLGMVFGFV